MRLRLFVCWLAVLVFLSIGGCRRPQPPQEAVEGPAPDTSKRAGSITLAVEPASIRLEPGLTAKLKVSATRQDFAGPIPLEVRNLPAGVTATPASLAVNQNSGEIELTAKPGTIPIDANNVQVAALAGDLKTPSPAFTVSVAKPSFTLTFEPAHLKVPKGESRPLKIIIKRNPELAVKRNSEAYTGPIDVELTDLPKYVKAAAKGKGQAPSEWFAFTLHAGADAAEGESAPLARVVAENQLKAVAPFPLTVQGLPFVLQAEPHKLNLVYGQSAKLKITATRKDYQGPIHLKLENLPGHVRAKPLTLKPQQSSGEIELTAAADATSFEKPAQVRATADDNRHAASSFDLKVEGRPFALHIQPARLDVVQGASAKLKVSAVRSKDFAGPIDLEVRNLPKHCKATLRTIASQSKDTEIEISAAEEAAPGDLSNLQIVAKALIGGEPREVKFDRLALRVLGPFALQVQPGKVDLLAGNKMTLKISAERRTYQGPIALELRNLPAGVTAAKAAIPEGQQSVELELASAATAASSEKTDVHVLGTADTNKQLASSNFTVAVVRKLFDLKVQPAVKLSFGGKAVLKVTVQRKEYQGPIALEMKNLPAQVKAGKTILPAGKNEVEIELAAADQAKEGKSEAQVIGAPLEGGSPQKIVAPFTLHMLPGLFELKVEPIAVQLHHGGSAKVKVIVLRKGYEGPITVELRNLPADMKADKATLAKGENQAEIEIKASSSVKDGAKVDVFARGAVSASKQVDSLRFTVSVVSIGQPPALELKVEPVLIKLSPNGSATVKVTVVRKGYAGPVSVDLRNLPAEVVSSKGMIAEGQNFVEVTLTATPIAEPALKVDVCAVGVAVDAANCPYASGRVSVQVSRK